MQWLLKSKLCLQLWLWLSLATVAGSAQCRAIAPSLSSRIGFLPSSALALSPRVVPALSTPLGDTDEPLARLLEGMGQACVSISRSVRAVSLEGNGGEHADALGGAATNVHGEKQKKMDKICDDILIDAILKTKTVRAIVSEEHEHPILSTIDSCADTFTVAVDPLDGSSNVDSGLPTGSLFAIFKHSSSVFSPSTWEERRLVAAGYCLYSAASHLMLVFPGVSGVQMFTLDDQTSTFRLTQSQVCIPPSVSIQAFNAAHSEQWPPPVKRFLHGWRLGAQVPRLAHSEIPSTRYFGALVADAHNILFRGGLFGYPGTERHPHGKLRLLYEAIPIAAIMESAGGMATNGTHRILDIPVCNVHQRTPLFFGSAAAVQALQAQWQHPE